KLKPRVIGSRRVTTWCGNKISPSSQAPSRPICKPNSDANANLQRGTSFRCNAWRGGQTIGFAPAEQGRETETAFAGTPECNPPALRLFSTVAKESAGVETRARCSVVERTRIGNGGCRLETKIFWG